MATPWPELSYSAWQETCGTLHAHTQVLGKLAVALAPPEPQLQHAALRLTARGWETAPLPAPDGSGAVVAAFYAYAHPAPEGFESATLSPPTARWEPALGEFILDWDEVIGAGDPRAAAMQFALSAFRHSCAACEWDPALSSSAGGSPPPVR